MKPEHDAAVRWSAWLGIGSKPKQNMDNETNLETGVSVNGALTINVNLKGSKRRYSPPDLKTEIPLNIGGKVSEIEALLDAELAMLRKRILFACGREGVAA